MRNRPPALDLAFEIELLNAGMSQSALFLYEWSDTALVVGKGQIASEINYQTCAAESIVVLRRESGGTAVLHNRTLNVGLILPAVHSCARSINGLYSAVGHAISLALARQGVNVNRVIKGGATPNRTIICFESHTDDSLLLNGRKVFGGAQRRMKHAILIHGALLLAVDIP